MRKYETEHVSARDGMARSRRQGCALRSVRLRFAPPPLTALATPMEGFYETRLESAVPEFEKRNAALIRS